MELHISPKNAALQRLTGFGYDDSRSAPKTDEQRKKILRSIYALIQSALEVALHPAIVKDGLSGNEDCTKWAIEEDRSIMTKEKDTCTFNIFADECPIFQTFITGSVFAVSRSHHLKIRRLTYACRWRRVCLQSDGDRCPLAYGNKTNLGCYFGGFLMLKPDRACGTHVHIRPKDRPATLSELKAIVRCATLYSDATLSRTLSRSLIYCQPTHNSPKLKDFKVNSGKGMPKGVEDLEIVCLDRKPPQGLSLGPQRQRRSRSCLEPPAGSRE